MEKPENFASYALIQYFSFLFLCLVFPHSNSETSATSIAAFAGTPGKVVRRNWSISVLRSWEGRSGWHLPPGGHYKGSLTSTYISDSKGRFRYEGGGEDGSSTIPTGGREGGEP